RVNAAHTISSATSTPPRRGWPRDDDTAIVIRMNEAGTIAPMRETNRRGPRVAAATSARAGRLADLDCGCSSAPRTAALSVTGFAPSLTVFLSQSSVDVGASRGRRSGTSQAHTTDRLTACGCLRDHTLPAGSQKVPRLFSHLVTALPTSGIRRGRV